MRLNLLQESRQPWRGTPAHRGVRLSSRGPGVFGASKNFDMYAHEVLPQPPKGVSTHVYNELVNPLPSHLGQDTPNCGKVIFVSGRDASGLQNLKKRRCSMTKDKSKPSKSGKARTSRDGFPAKPFDISRVNIKSYECRDDSPSSHHEDDCGSLSTKQICENPSRPVDKLRQNGDETSQTVTIQMVNGTHFSNGQLSTWQLANCQVTNGQRANDKVVNDKVVNDKVVNDKVVNKGKLVNKVDSNKMPNDQIAKREETNGQKVNSLSENSQMLDNEFGQFRQILEVELDEEKLYDLLSEINEETGEKIGSNFLTQIHDRNKEIDHFGFKEPNKTNETSTTMTNLSFYISLSVSEALLPFLTESLADFYQKFSNENETFIFDYLKELMINCINLKQRFSEYSDHLRIEVRQEGREAKQEGEMILSRERSAINEGTGLNESISPPDIFSLPRVTSSSLTAVTSSACGSLPGRNLPLKNFEGLDLRIPPARVLRYPPGKPPIRGDRAWGHTPNAALIHPLEKPLIWGRRRSRDATWTDRYDVESNQSTEESESGSHGDEDDLQESQEQQWYYGRSLVVESDDGGGPSTAGSESENDRSPVFARPPLSVVHNIPKVIFYCSGESSDEESVVLDNANCCCGDKWWCDMPCRASSGIPLYQGRKGTHFPSSVKPLSTGKGNLTSVERRFSPQSKKCQQEDIPSGTTANPTTQSRSEGSEGNQEPNLTKSLCYSRDSRRTGSLSKSQVLRPPRGSVTDGIRSPTRARERSNDSQRHGFSGNKYGSCNQNGSSAFKDGSSVRKNCSSPTGRELEEAPTKPLKKSHPNKSPLHLKPPASPSLRRGNNLPSSDAKERETKYISPSHKNNGINRSSGPHPTPPIERKHIPHESPTPARPPPLPPPPLPPKKKKLVDNHVSELDSTPHVKQPSPRNSPRTLPRRSHIPANSPHRNPSLNIPPKNNVSISVRNLPVKKSPLRSPPSIASPRTVRRGGSLTPKDRTPNSKPFGSNPVLAAKGGRKNNPDDIDQCRKLSNSATEIDKEDETADDEATVEIHSTNSRYFNSPSRRGGGIVSRVMASSPRPTIPPALPVKSLARQKASQESPFQGKPKLDSPITNRKQISRNVSTTSKMYSPLGSRNVASRSSLDSHKESTDSGCNSPSYGSQSSLNNDGGGINSPLNPKKFNNKTSKSAKTDLSNASLRWKNAKNKQHGTERELKRREEATMKTASTKHVLNREGKGKELINKDESKEVEKKENQIKEDKFPKDDDNGIKLPHKTPPERPFNRHSYPESERTASKERKALESGSQTVIANTDDKERRKENANNSTGESKNIDKPQHPNSVESVSGATTDKTIAFCVDGNSYPDSSTENGEIGWMEDENRRKRSQTQTASTERENSKTKKPSSPTQRHSTPPGGVGESLEGVPTQGGKGTSRSKGLECVGVVLPFDYNSPEKVERDRDQSFLTQRVEVMGGTENHGERVRETNPFLKTRSVSPLTNEEGKFINGQNKSIKRESKSIRTDSEPLKKISDPLKENEYSDKSLMEENELLSNEEPSQLKDKSGLLEQANIHENSKIGNKSTKSQEIDETLIQNLKLNGNILNNQFDAIITTLQKVAETMDYSSDCEPHHKNIDRTRSYDETTTNLWHNNHTYSSPSLFSKSYNRSISSPAFDQGYHAFHSPINYFPDNRCIIELHDTGSPGTSRDNPYYFSSTIHIQDELPGRGQEPSSQRINGAHTPHRRQERGSGIRTASKALSRSRELLSHLEKEYKQLKGDTPVATEVLKKGPSGSFEKNFKRMFRSLQLNTNSDIKDDQMPTLGNDINKLDSSGRRAKRSKSGIAEGYFALLQKKSKTRTGPPPHRGTYKDLTLQQMGVPLQQEDSQEVIREEGVETLPEEGDAEGQTRSFSLPKSFLSDKYGVSGFKSALPSRRNGPTRG